MAQSIKLFAFGFRPTTRASSRSLPRRLVWKLHHLGGRIVHHHNFGDYLSYQLVSWLASSRVLLAEQSESGKLLAIGSILWSLQDDDVIWGSGAHRANQIPRRSNVKCLAVRGPLTLQELRRANVVAADCRPLFFDPGVLVSLLFSGLRTLSSASGGTLVIPHYSDLATVRQMVSKLDLPVDVVNPFCRPIRIAEKIARSERVISSSLHGLIFADALGIPAIPLRLDGNKEPPFKYEDYFEGTGRPVPGFSSNIVHALDRDPRAFRYSEVDLNRFVASFPFSLNPGIQ
jgi:pyruvyltransferase